VPETEDKNLTNSLTRFSLDRRITVFVSLLTIIVVGIIASLGIPLETFPSGYEFPAVHVSVPWRDAPAQAVLEKITLPLEEEVSTVRNIDGLNSWTRNGNGGVFVRFKRGTDMDIAYREVRDRVERARLLFPEDVERAYIYKHDLSGIPLVAIGVAVDTNIHDVYNLIQKDVILPLRRIDGVANVRSDGVREKEILIEIDKTLSDAHNINIYNVAQELGGDNFTMASGTVRDAGKKFLLRSVAAYKSVEELQNRRINATTRLKDIATITYEAPERRHVVRVNRKPAFALVVQKESEANTVAVCREVQKVLDSIKDNPRLATTEMQAFFNQGEVIEDSLGNLINNGRVGGFLAALVLFVFLRQGRLTAIIAMSIPLCLLIALVVMFFLGESLNILTILGLVICVGLLVDNSVVVAENILRLRNDGHSKRDACIRGASQIALAITLATLTTVAVFLPMSLVEGEGKFFMLRMAIPICVSLIASLGVALVFIPLSVYLTFPKRHDPEHDSTLKPTLYGRFIWLVERFYALTFDKLKMVYNLALAASLRRRLELVIILAVSYYLTVTIAFKEVGLAGTQEEDKLSLRIGIRTSNEFTFEETAAYFEKVEAIVDSRRAEYGLTGFYISHGKRGGQMEAWLEKDAPRDLTAKEIGTKLYQELPKQAGVSLYYSEMDRSKDAKGPDVFTLRLEGDDATILEDIAEALEPIVTQVDGVIGVRLDNEDAPSEMALIVDREQATASQVNPRTLAGMIGYALRGSGLPRYNEKGKQIPVRVRYREKDRETLSDLENFYVPTETGSFIPISALTTPKMLDTPRGINRRDRKVTHSLVLELEKDKAKEARETLLAIQELIDLPEGVRFQIDRFSWNNEDLASMQFAAVMSVLFIYLLMGVLFESFILPLSIVVTIPLASIGVGWIHYITEKDMDMLGIVGIILLIGVVVNNGIVLIDYVNRLRRDGMERTEALLKGADRRFRPIVMTALTTIIGMLPLTVSKPSAIGMSYKSFGLTLIGGMTTATILTLLIIPVFYTFFDDARVAFARTLKRILAKGRGGKAVAEPIAADSEATT
jgi:hydrophobic/amphiphilic exporter-1 (mainly G- bacteria), HAE1 family